MLEVNKLITFNENSIIFLSNRPLHLNKNTFGGCIQMFPKNIN